ncbi:helicase-exonuclease AddAB subunit AddA [Lacticaseibacillus kribbianus]|uniref:helicase-exonuclease AddAB subunit AddA n=1 Tax=Lacticaseibacillus kribbianus TaxID=2926292 RepID=UPI001CD33BF7|nr:helicase-exonuclease AddAB subunit AddA [Lacticaseibacillus kribbianus]
MGFTTDQLNAIRLHGSDLLVSASAGSGKTAVLVRRIVEDVEAGADVTRMLIVTFTNAATAEMKLKIQKALKAELTAEPKPGAAPLDEATRRHVANQVAKMNAASIMTLDAFSLQVVHQYYYVINLAPGFRQLTDDTEALMIQTDVWAKLVEELYDGPDAAAFAALADNFATKPTGTELQDIVFELTDFAATTPDPAAWLAAFPEGYTPEGTDRAVTTWLWPAIKDQLVAAASDLEALRQRVDLPGGELAVFAGNLADTLDAVTNAIAEDPTTYAAAQAAVAGISWPRWPTVRKLDDDLKAIKEAVKGDREVVKKRVDKLIAQLAITPEDLAAVQPAAHAMMQQLSRVAARYAAALAAEKARRQVMGFTDIAQAALRILTTVDPATGESVAAAYQDQFDAVLVDEYQDINQLQEALLKAVSRKNPGNRFMVGDVKQSIYGFRLADPTLFLTKYRRFAGPDADPAQVPGRRIDLTKNFRSSQNVLSFTNLVFSQIMDRQVGELDYDKPAQLVLGDGDKYRAFAPTTEFLIHVTQSGESEEDSDEEGDTQAALDRDQAEVRMVIAHIQKMVQDPTYTLYDSDLHTTRRIRYQDITLLTRASKQNVILQSEFAAANVPIVVGNAKKYFKTTELMVMLSLLRIIDNPLQEIALVAVLRSPIVGLSADALALIRLAAPRATFDEALTRFAKQTGGTAQAQATRTKVTAFLANLTEFRDFAREHALVDLVWHLYDRTGYLDFVGGLPGGSQRQANLQALAGRAASYEQGGFKGLFAFIHFIELMQKKAKDLATPVTLEPDVDAVRLMTIHASKGLQFPVVFLLNTGKRMNDQDLRRPVIATAHGVGVNWVDPVTRVSYPLPQYEAAKVAKDAQLTAEEMRLLYVALTRAEQRLVIIGSTPDQAKLEAKWARDQECDTLLLPAGRRAAARTYLDWLGMAIARTAAVADHDSPLLAPFATPISVTFIDRVEAPVTATHTASSAAPAAEADSPIDDWLAFTYPHALATRTTGFQTVSEIKQAYADPTQQELLAAAAQTDGNRFVSDFASPRFLTATQAASATAIGTATHLVLQLVDLAQPLDAAHLTALIERLIEDGSLDAAVAAQIAVANLVTFFTTPLGAAIVANRQTLHREAAFSLLRPAKSLFADMQNETADILVHGIIDGYFTTEAGITLFDYKTDHVTADLGPLVERYRGQLAMYAAALEAATGQTVRHQYLVALATGAVVDLAAQPE